MITLAQFAAQMQFNALQSVFACVLAFIAVFGVHLAQILAVVFGADIFIATAHFLMDRFGDPTCKPKFMGLIFANNQMHHAFPSAILRHGPLANASETLTIGFAIVVIAWLLHVLTWHVVLFAAAVAASAIIHRWQHLPIKDVHCMIKWLQAQGIIQSRAHHSAHHRRHDVNYAVLTNAANHVLEHTKLLWCAEWLIVQCCEMTAVDLRVVSERKRDVSRVT